MRFWVVEHPPVFTQGLPFCVVEHLLHHTTIPVVKPTAGQITYHGPGQLVVYLLLNVKRYGYGVRELVAAYRTGSDCFVGATRD